MSEIEKANAKLKCPACGFYEFSVYYIKAKNRVTFYGLFTIAKASKASIEVWCLCCGKVTAYEPGSITVTSL